MTWLRRETNTVWLFCDRTCANIFQTSAEPHPHEQQEHDATERLEHNHRYNEDC